MSNVVKIRYYFVMAILVQVGVFAMRWNVVIGGQLSSKSFRGMNHFNLELFGREGFLMFATILSLPFIILFVLTKMLPPWKSGHGPEELPATAA